MNAPTLSDWTGANREHVAAKFTRLRALLGEGDLAEAAAEVERRRALTPAPPAVDVLARLSRRSRRGDGTGHAPAAVPLPTSRRAMRIAGNSTPGARVTSTGFTSVKPQAA